MRFSVLLIPAVLALAISVAPPVASASAAPHASRHQRHLTHKRAVRQARHRRAAARQRVARVSRRVAPGGAKAAVGTSVAVSASPPANDGVIFQGGFENGFANWHLQSLPERATIVPGAFAGAQAARFEVRPGDVEPETGSNRSEVSGPTFDEGQDLYIRDAIRVPSANTYNGSWQIVQQLHETEWSGSPGLAVFLDANRAISIGSGDGSTAYWYGPELQPDRWYELTYHVKLSRDSSVGFVEVWLDGAQQTLANGQAKSYGQTIQTSHTYLKAGIYRSDSSTGISVVEYGNVIVGESYADVLGA